MKEKDINIITGKLLVGGATRDECHEYIRYVSMLESLLDEVDRDDYFGTEGWRHHIGLED